MQLKALGDTGEEEKVCTHCQGESLDHAAGSALQLWVLVGVGAMLPWISGNYGPCAPSCDGEAKSKINLWLAFPGQEGAHPLPGADPPMI